MGRPPTPAITRFLSKVFKDPATGCWLWTGGLGDDGYGIFRDENSKNVRVHRWSYEYHTAQITNPTLYVCHTCDTPRCVNPAHLWLGTHQQNEDDKDAKGRRIGAHKGEENHRAVLTEDKVRDIRTKLAAGQSQNSIAIEYGVSPATIAKIKKNKTWKDVK